ncbi:GIY-YIG nuclease family protein [Hydrogenophaga sp. IBVHS2]|uniref:GIY-YIG nuclease family protein n=1 Tax=Hydrogenophaga sp. IBVHS2 TaxID=1985170 RepID=UPI00117BD8D3|nr:GIY-YIG nuclease family protein [Hydrogenophaga sp. IBVHS2]
MNELNWKHSTLLHGAAARVPERPGLYVIAATRRAASLPMSLDPIYAGRTENLRRRLIEHADPWREHNRDVTAAMLAQDLEFWFTEVPKEQLTSLERELIRTINPAVNRVRYTKGAHDE